MQKKQKKMYHVLYGSVGTVLSLTGDWFRGKSKRQKQNNDSFTQETVTELLKLAVTERFVPLYRACSYSVIEIDNNTSAISLTDCKLVKNIAIWSCRLKQAFFAFVPLKNVTLRTNAL